MAGQLVVAVAERRAGVRGEPAVADPEVAGERVVRRNVLGGVVAHDPRRHGPAAFGELARTKPSIEGTPFAGRRGPVRPVRSRVAGRGESRVAHREREGFDRFAVQQVELPAAQAVDVVAARTARGGRQVR